MMIVMQEGATEEQIRAVTERIETAGARAHLSRGEFVTVIGAIGDDRELIASLSLDGEPGVEKVVPILKPFKLVSREFRHEDTVVEVSGRRIGGGVVRPDRRALHGRVARPDAGDGPRGQGRRREHAPRRGLQAAHLALHLPGPGPAGPGHPGRGARGDRAADRHRADGRAPARRRARGGRRDPARRAQHAELRPAARGRARRPAGAAEAGRVEHDRGVAPLGRVRGQGGQRPAHPVRAGHPHLRDRDALHARHLRRPGGEGRCRACR